MKSCEYNQLLSLYMDNQLDAEQMNSLERHLHLCPQCQTEIAELIELKRHCMELPEEDISADFHQRLMSRIKAEDTRKGGRLIRRILAPVAAAVFLFIIGQSILNSDLSGLKSAPGDDRLRNQIISETDRGQITQFSEALGAAEDADMRMAEVLPETADYTEEDEPVKDTDYTIYIIAGVMVTAAVIGLARWRKVKKENTR